MTPVERPAADLRARLLAAVARQPTARPGAWGRRALGAAAGVVLWLVAAIAVLGLRRDLANLPTMALVTTLLPLLAVAIGASLIGLARGRAMVGAATGTLAATAWGSLLLLLAVVLVVDPGGATTWARAGGAGSALRCLTLTVGLALPLIALGAAVPRGLILARPALAGACVGLGAATWAHALVRLHCTIPGAEHALVGHLLPALPLMALGAWVWWAIDRRSRRGGSPGR